MTYVIKARSYKAAAEFGFAQRGFNMDAHIVEVLTKGSNKSARLIEMPSGETVATASLRRSLDGAYMVDVAALDEPEEDPGQDISKAAACAEALARAINDACVSGGTVQSVVDKVRTAFDDETIGFVLAHEIISVPYDGRISKDNREWAEHFRPVIERSLKDAVPADRSRLTYRRVCNEVHPARFNQTASAFRESEGTPRPKPEPV